MSCLARIFGIDDKADFDSAVQETNQRPTKRQEAWLTVLGGVRLAVGSLHGALGQPHGPLLDGLALAGLPALVLLLLHADDHVLGVHVAVRRALAGPGLALGPRGAQERGGAVAAGRGGREGQKGLRSE